MDYLTGGKKSGVVVSVEGRSVLAASTSEIASEEVLFFERQVNIALFDAVHIAPANFTYHLGEVLPHILHALAAHRASVPEFPRLRSPDVLL